MTKPTPLLIALLALTILGGQWLYKKKCNCDINADVSVPPKQIQTTTSSFISLSDAFDFNTTAQDNLRFKLSEFEHQNPLSPSLQKVFSQTADYLKSHSNRSLTITGFYTEGEKNNSTFPTLGLARANDIKKLMTNLGASASQIELADEKVGDTFFVNDTIVGAARYEFTNLNISDNKLMDIEKRLRAKPIVLHFATNQSNIELTVQQKQDFSDLLYFLEHKDGVKSIVEGHTDNVGNAANNIELSKKRAAFVRDYMAKVGFPSDKILTDGKGAAVPLASNNSVEGRSLNRRVEIGIQ